MSENCLVEIPVKDFPALRDKFKVEWPSHIFAFSLIDNLISRIVKNPQNEGKTKIYCLNGDWSDGTFVAAMRERDVLFATLNPSFQNLKVLLKLLDFTNMKFFMSLRSIYLSVIEEMAKEEHLEILFNVPTTVTMLKKEKAKTFDVVIPASFQVRPLQTEDAFDINSVWPQKGDGTEEFVSYMIENNTNVGLYNESDELIAWCLKHDFGSLASLQVDEHHLKKGYGETVTKAICKKVAIECDVDITASIVHDNYKSKNLFKKLGFENIDTNFWIGVKKKLK